MSQETYEALMPGVTKEELYNLTNQQGGRDIISDLQIVKSNEAIKDYLTKEYGNNLTLAPSTRAGIMMETPMTTITGLGKVIIEPTVDYDTPNAGIIQYSMVFQLPEGNPAPSPEQHQICHFNNLHFTGQVVLIAGPVTTNPTAIFTNCTFEHHVTVQTGCSAHFHGCFFYNLGFIFNAGTAYILGGSRKSLFGHGGITATYGETN